MRFRLFARLHIGCGAHSMRQLWGSTNTITPSFSVATRAVDAPMDDAVILIATIFR